MNRVVLTCLLVMPALASADLKADLQKKYSQLDSYLVSRNVDGAEKWLADNTTSDFKYRSRDKNTYDRAKFLDGVRQQIAATKKVSQNTTKVTSVKKSGNQTIVTTSSQTTAIMVFDTKSMKLVDKSLTRDVWVKIDGNWKMKSSVQTGGSTQMYEQ